MPLNANGHATADRDVTELFRWAATLPALTHEPDHAAGCRVFHCRCGCDPAQTCQDCHRCLCWRAQCCAHRAVEAEQSRAWTTALRRVLDPIGLKTLTELRQTVADAEEAALRKALSHRTRLLAAGDGVYTLAVFGAVDGKLGMGHADYSDTDIDLYTQGQNDPTETIDLDDDVLSYLLGSLAALVRPDEGARLEVDLTQAPH
ncbi:hypothetical protein [Streptomyces solaniscabiei]|uniref:hypothetical protein n=1 Tax=Streptomyces solaniscabiei TaxID=2683255 RepID=UPI001CE352E9|nr:hypothetical protein [Streptomyces solaniscabiei]